MQLVERFSGNRNINQLIAEHLPSKTAKQISDKLRLLARGPFAKDQAEPESGVVQGPGSAQLPKEGQLRLQYHKVIEAGLSADRFTTHREASKKILDGQDLQQVVNDIYDEFLGVLVGAGQNVKSKSKGRKSQASRG